MFEPSKLNNFIVIIQDDVIDIREQFPINREITIKIAEQMNINHPQASSTQTPIVMTTDFLITLRHGSKFDYIARTIKPEKELNSKVELLKRG